MVPSYPIVLAANRDELRERQGTPPRQVTRDIWAGIDPKAGGTWLGVNSQGRVVAVANRRSPVAPDPNAPSRGLLCLSSLQEEKDSRLRDKLEQQTREQSYNPFNSLVADRAKAWTATYSNSTLELKNLDPGIHIIANTLPNNRDDPKITRGMMLLSRPNNLDSGLQMLKKVCCDHGTRAETEDAICIHGSQDGTLSSTVLAIHEVDFTSSRLEHAQGNPCQSEYRDYADLLRL